MRKLASLQRIESLRPIPNADRIEVAKVLGWDCVVGKGYHREGDLVIYCEIDSVLPLDRFPELENCKGRIRTMKLRGQISQGYVIPFPVVREILEDNGWLMENDNGHFCMARSENDGTCEYLNLMEGIDFTDALGINKYEPPITFENGDAKGSFPDHILPRTDETRVQSDPSLIERITGKPYEITVKCDGTSGTYGIDEDGFFACSRNLMIKEGGNVYWNIAKKYRLDEIMLDKEFSHLVIQGEICGPGIQKNRLGLKAIDMFVFNVFDKTQKRYYDYHDMGVVCNALNLKRVPLFKIGDSFEYSMDDLLKLAESKYEGTTNEREGIVIRGFHKSFNNYYGKILSFKAISNRYLIKDSDA